MSKIMLINVTHAEESRVGIVEDGQLESFEIESLSREHLKGNIYKGIVRRIHPAIEAAFVDIGAERDAFLPLDEICFRNLPSGRNGSSGGEKGRRRIKEVLKSGDEVLVQIVKEQFTNKPPTLSTFYSLPGRYLVLLPGSEDAGISRKIEGEERVRVREMIQALDPPPGCGIIVRTAAGFDEQSGELERDLNYLQRLWGSIKKHAETKRAPTLVYREHDLVLRTIRDYFTPDINEIFIDNEEVYERAKDFLMNVMPGKEHILKLYQGERPIFSRFGLEAQIESIYKRRVQLKSGGSIVIDGTEALTAIDVNSGGSMRGGSQEETAYKTNLEAATEIARQLRLRDLGGIIVVDFIDMRTPSNINDVERTLREAMRADKARHDIGRISRLGLLEVSRQRLRPAAAASSYTACPMCEGHGAVRTTESAALVALRKVHVRIAEGDIEQMRVALPREVAMYLLNQKRDDLAVLEARYAARIQVVVDDKLMPHQSEIDTRTRDPREVMERPLSIVRPGDVAVAAPVEAAANGPTRRAATPRAAHPRTAEKTASASRSAARPAADGQTDESKHRRRRRGGRDRKPSTAAGAEGTSASMSDEHENAVVGEPAARAGGDAGHHEPAAADAGASAPQSSAFHERDTAAEVFSASAADTVVTTESAPATRWTSEASSERHRSDHHAGEDVKPHAADAAAETTLRGVEDVTDQDDAPLSIARALETRWRDDESEAWTRQSSDAPESQAPRADTSESAGRTDADESAAESVSEPSPDAPHRWDRPDLDDFVATMPSDRGDRAGAKPAASLSVEPAADSSAADDASVDLDEAQADPDVAHTIAAPEGQEGAAMPRRRRRRGGRRGGRGRRSQRGANAGGAAEGSGDSASGEQEQSAAAGLDDHPSGRGSRRRRGTAPLDDEPSAHDGDRNPAEPPVES
jgi:ribonuclease E